MLQIINLTSQHIVSCCSCAQLTVAVAENWMEGWRGDSSGRNGFLVAFHYQRLIQGKLVVC